VKLHIATVAGVLVLVGAMSAPALENLHRLTILHAWMNLRPNQSLPSLAGGMPPAWSASFWGEAKGAATVDRAERALRVDKNNLTDYAVVGTSIAVTAGEAVGCLCELRGLAAFLRADDTEGNIAFGAVPASKEWTHFSVHFSPARSGVAKFSIGTHERGMLWIRSAQCTTGGRRPKELIATSTFSAPVRPDAGRWWMTTAQEGGDPQEVVAAARALARSGDRSAETMAAKLLMGDAVSDRCGAAAMLSGISSRVGDLRGPGAAEMVCDFAIKSSPECPQGYRQKARLYEREGIPSTAAALYEAAAARSPSPDRGRDYFGAGVLRLERTGQTDAAIEDLSAARQYHGWESSIGSEGIAESYLVSALARDGRCNEARTLWASSVGRTDAGHHDGAEVDVKRFCNQDSGANPR
jgi:hypothetical protein